MERPEESLEDYLDTLDWRTRQQVIQRESLWHLLPEEPAPPATGPEPHRRGNLRRQRRR